MPRYRAYGLALESHLTLPCVRADTASAPDVVIEPGAAARFDRVREWIGPADGDWFRSRRLDDGTFYLEWTGSFAFLISGDGSRVEYEMTAAATPDSFAVYLLGQVLSFSLLARGIEPLHSTVVVIDGRAIAFLGDCGTGKSTLASAMVSRGFRLLTDDLMVLAAAHEAWIVEPGIPRLKLFPSVARRVLGLEETGTPMIDGTSKLVLPLDDVRAADLATPLAAMYVLDRRAPRARRTPTPAIEPLSEAAGFMEIIRGAFNLIANDRDRLTNQFAFAARLSRSVPVRSLTYARTLSTLPKVCDALLADLESAAVVPAMNA